MAAVMYPIAYFMYMKGYTTGKAGVEAILSGGKMKQLIQAASIMGATVLGSLTANYVSATSKMKIQIGASKLMLQTDILDKLLKGGVPLGISACCNWFDLWYYRNFRIKNKGKGEE